MITSRFANVNYNRNKKVNQPPLYLWRLPHKLQKIFDKFKLIPNLINKLYPNNKIIIRPHPSENIETWKKLLKRIRIVR